MTGPHDSRAKTRRASGFTLLEVILALGLAVVVLAGLASATLAASKTSREAARVGVAERALHEALSLIAADLRANNGAGEYRCGQAGALTVNGFDIAWRTSRLSLDANGEPREEASCGSAPQQHTLLVRASTVDGNATVTRETIVSLLRGDGPVIASFTVDQPQVRSGETVTLSWRLAANPPAGTVTYLNGQRVETDPVTLTGTATQQVVQTEEFELRVDSRFGGDARTLTVEAGEAPIYRVLRTTPEKYLPGQPLTFHWEIDSQPLPLLNAQRQAGNGVPSQALPTAPGASGRVTGQHTIVTPPNARGDLTFHFTASNSAGDARRSIVVQDDCRAPIISLQANPAGPLKLETNDPNPTVTVNWSTQNAVRATYTPPSGAPVNLSGASLSSGSRQETLTVGEGETKEFAFTLDAEGNCGDKGSRTVRVTVERAIAQPPPGEPPEEDGDMWCKVLVYGGTTKNTARVVYSADMSGWSGGSFREPNSSTGWATFTDEIDYDPSLGTHIENVEPGKTHTFRLTVKAKFTYTNKTGHKVTGWRTICTDTARYNAPGDSGDDGGSGGGGGSDDGSSGGGGGSDDGSSGGGGSGGSTPPDDPPACYVPPDDFKCLCDDKTGKKVCLSTDARQRHRPPITDARRHAQLYSRVRHARHRDRQRTRRSGGHHARAAAPRKRQLYARGGVHIPRHPHRVANRAHGQRRDIQERAARDDLHHTLVRHVAVEHRHEVVSDPLRPRSPRRHQRR